MARMSDISKIAKRAAQWWADILAANNLGSAGAAEVDLLYAICSRPAPNNEELSTFRDALESSIAEELIRRDRLFISVDYGPDQMLHEAAGALKVSWPFKTSMNITRTEITVSAGYRAHWETLEL